jgi:hypothetical protein
MIGKGFTYMDIPFCLFLKRRLPRVKRLFQDRNSTTIQMKAAASHFTQYLDLHEKELATYWDETKLLDGCLTYLFGHTEADELRDTMKILYGDGVKLFHTLRAGKTSEHPIDLENMGRVEERLSLRQKTFAEKRPEYQGWIKILKEVVSGIDGLNVDTCTCEDIFKLMDDFDYERGELYPVEGAFKFHFANLDKAFTNAALCYRKLKERFPLEYNLKVKTLMYHVKIFRNRAKALIDLLYSTFPSRELQSLKN